MKVAIGHAGRPLPGETESGDQWTVVTDGPRHLAVLADGLGHGPAAALAARAAVSFFAARPWEPLEPLVWGCHRALTHTRGAALSLLRIDEQAGEASFLGVGNVELAAVTVDPVRPVPVPGVVGGRLRKVWEVRIGLRAGDLLVLHTDGISSRFDPRELRGLDAGVAARRLLAGHAKDHDDAACIVVTC
jgi:hypothetical protein